MSLKQAVSQNSLGAFDDEDLQPPVKKERITAMAGTISDRIWIELM